jgi:hypothetical protein
MVPSRNIRIGCLIVLCAFASAFGQTTRSETQSATHASAAQEFPPHVTADERGPLALQFMDDRLVVWQQRFKMEDWRISVAWVRLSDLPPRTLGGIRWDKRKKSAEILVLDPSDYRLPFREMLDDMELTLVHELVHLDLASLPRGQASRGSEERAVSGIADAMLALDRKKP